MDETPNPQTWTAEGRVTFTHPGKHGLGDIKVEFAGAAPTFGEALAIIWGLFRSEDRYDQPWQQGRAMLKGLVDELYQAHTWQEARLIVEHAKASVQERRAA